MIDEAQDRRETSTDTTAHRTLTPEFRKHRLVLARQDRKQCATTISPLTSNAQNPVQRLSIRLQERAADFRGRRSQD